MDRPPKSIWSRKHLGREQALRAKAYVSDGLAEEISVETLAGLVKLSPFPHVSIFKLQPMTRPWSLGALFSFLWP